MSMDAVNSGFPLLPEQQRLLDKAGQQGTWAEVAHLVQVEIAGELDLARLRGALDALVQRFPVLATRIGQVPGYNGLRQLAGEGGGFPLQVVAEPGPAESVAALFEAWAGAPHPIPGGVHLGGLLQCLEPGRWRLSLGVARFIVDARSMGLLCEALFDAYAGRGQGAGDDDAAASFEQYLEWHAEVAVDEDAAEGKRYWAEHLGAGGASPDLPYRRSGRIATGRGEVLERRLAPVLVAGLERLARADGLPVERVLQAGWWALLARISGRSTLLAAWRHDARCTYEFFAGAPGVLERTLPLCQALEGDGRLRAACTALAARLEQHETWQEYWIAGSGPAVPTLACGFTSRPALPGREITGSTWQARALPEQAAEFDLLLQVLSEEGVPATLVLEYRADLYGQAAMRGLLEQYLGLLQAMLEGDPQLCELPPPGEAERARLLALNPAPRELGQAEGLLPQRIARWAERTPDGIAIACGEEALTWRELDAQVRQLSARLHRSGVGAGDLVGLALPRSIAWVVSLLAAWRLGAAYVPLDPLWPPARQAQVLEQAGARRVLVATEVADIAGVKALQVPGGPDEAAGDAPPAHATTGEEVAYVLFTSGSTGLPKGVVIEHRNLFNYTAAASEAMGLEDCRRVAFSSSVSADLGNTALFGALYNGATLHVADDPTMQSPAAFARYLEANRIDCLKMVPSHLAALLEAERPNLPRTLVLGGEALPPALAERVLRIRPDCRLFNHYGPTETTVGVLVHPVVEADLGELGIPLTRVLANNRVHVLDEQRRPVPVGVLGELYIGGQQVSRGYLAASAEQREAFVVDPFDPGQVLYRSGDLARYRPEGGIQLYGRKDQQVKIRGHRVEPAETEQALLLLPAVTEAAVVVRHPGEGAELVAFVVVQGTLPEDPASELRGALRAYLPESMLPAQVQVVVDMPRLANGKIDRQALQGRELQAVQRDFVAPRDALEELLSTRMAQLLGLERLSMDQDFFAAGGHSLLVIKLVAGIRKLLQCEASPGIVFDHPTPAALAQALRALETVPGQLLKLAQARLRLDALSPEERAVLLEKARQLQAT